MGRGIRNQLSMDQILKMVELTEKGKYRRQIAEEIGVNPSTVWRYQKHFGLV